MTPDQLHALLNKYGIKPRREQGQNFLLDDQVIEDTINAAQLTKDDTVLEIGPGLGVLTQQLAQQAGRVVAVEQDRDMIPALKKILKIFGNVELHNADIRTFHLAEAHLRTRQYKMVANLPYNITSWVMRYFLEHEPKPSQMVVMVQKEVAERMIAEPGKMSVLANAVQLYATAEIIRIVPPTSFYPAPKVESAVISIRIRPQALSPEPEALMRLVKICFASKRKQLHNNLQAGLHISAVQAKALIASIGLREDIRPQDLSIQDWEALRCIS
ncbi:MAG: ribosomal RNA small subunit methyltransferase A [Candidatus Kerfeldbacteria bacterium]|nr:ribosomal RNA small subunit methyltransferase A [Candidatus Kerfeldbacteria bacterium]